MAVVTINALDAGNPLFLQNNDHSNVPLIGFKLTGTENYKMWSTAMIIALTCKNNSLSPDLYLGQVYSQIASEVWDELQETYDKIDGSNIKSNILARDPLPDVKEAFNVVPGRSLIGDFILELGLGLGTKCNLLLLWSNLITLGGMNLEGNPNLTRHGVTLLVILMEKSLITILKHLRVLLLLLGLQAVTPPNRFAAKYGSESVTS
ncbi:hypothetical protein Tco_1352403 [Tanacetum coccineum]